MMLITIIADTITFYAPGTILSTLQTPAHPRGRGSIFHCHFTAEETKPT